MRVAIVGAGITGLAAARFLRAAGVESYQVFELDAAVGGNSRGGEIAGQGCPWGAHYLPAPSLTPRSPSEQALLEMLREFGVLRDGPGGPRYAEEMLCHAPQERVLVSGQWQSGLLPVEGVSPGTRLQYQHFAQRVERERRRGGFELPAVLPAPGDRRAIELDQTRFDRWLDDLGFDDRSLRWYLDYCCRDDYGAGSAEVSAWAGLHYFASRHGFEAPRDPGRSIAGDTTETPLELLTWPQGNQWLVGRMANPHREQILTDCMVTGVEAGDLRTVRLRVHHAIEQRDEDWVADVVILAVPLNVVARVLRPMPAALERLAPRLRYSAWQVANVHLNSLPPELPGAPLSWDNVVLGSEWLGYVDAGHQALRSHRNSTVFTSYRALGTDLERRRQLLSRSWRDQTTEVLDLFRLAYPRIDRHVSTVEIARWGHAMLTPTPALRSDPAFAALRATPGRVVLAHPDLAGYSVFEEAFAAGHSAAAAVMRVLRR